MKFVEHNMLTLKELTERENKLLVQVHEIVGSMNEKTQQLTKSGIFDSYSELHNSYASLAKMGNLEALKRAFFIQWYAVSEPPCFTGIPSVSSWGDGKGLNKDTEKVVFDLVSQFISSDDELKWMAAWYYQISDYYFESFGSQSVLLENLRRYIQDVASLVNNPKLNEETFEKRGQMGEYFMSVFQANEGRAK